MKSRSAPKTTKTKKTTTARRPSAASFFRSALAGEGVDAHPPSKRKLDKVWRELGGIGEAQALDELWQAHDRVDVCFDEYEYVPCEGALAEWRSMKGARDECFADSPWTEPVDPGVQALFWNERWLPFARDGRGGVVCVDLAPAPAGVVGQVIFVGRDPDERTVLGASLQEWLASVTFSAIPVP